MLIHVGMSQLACILEKYLRRSVFSVKLFGRKRQWRKDCEDSRQKNVNKSSSFIHEHSSLRLGPTPRSPHFLLSVFWDNNA